MRKILAAVLGGAVLVSSLGLSACGKQRGGMNSYKLKAEYDPVSQTLTADMEAEIVNTSAVALAELKFELWPNAYREGAALRPVSSLFEKSAYYGGASYGDIRITGVEGAESFSVGGDDQNILTLVLKEPLPRGERAAVGCSFEVKLAKANHRLGVTAHTVNLANFYPALCHLEKDGFREYVYASCGDPFVSGLANYDVTLTLPETMLPVCGFPAEELADENPEDGKRAYHVRAEGVRDIAFVLGENFRKVSAEAAGHPVEYYYFADKDPEATLKAAAESLAFFSEKFCGYHLPAYTVAETDFVYGGMEFPALSMLSSSLVKADRTAAVVHETAHQWWYSMVGSNQFENAWQDEGLAEYSAALFFEEHPAYGLSYQDLVLRSEQSYRAFFSVYSQVHGEADTSMTRPLTAFSGDYEYRNIAYDKGVILFDRLRDAVGKKKLFSALSRYAQTYAGCIASPEDLISCFGKGTSALFSSFLDGKCVI